MSVSDALPQRYIVYFGFGRSEVPDSELAKIETATNTLERMPDGRIRLTGHSDRAGSPEANRRIARARAEAVKRVMVREGVQRNRIRVRSAGEGDPVVATPDGVREPRNRRVEIRLIKPAQ